MLMRENLSAHIVGVFLPGFQRTEGALELGIAENGEDWARIGSDVVLDALIVGKSTADPAKKVGASRATGGDEMIDPGDTGYLVVRLDDSLHGFGDEVDRGGGADLMHDFGAFFRMALQLSQGIERACVRFVINGG